MRYLLRTITIGVVTVAALGLSLLTALEVTRPAAVGAVEHPAIDVAGLDPIPVRGWGVSGQNPNDTQTETLDVLVWDMVQSGDRMFVAGAFLNVQEAKRATPVPQPYLAAFDVASGQWIDTFRPSFDRAIYAIDVLPNGSLLVGGEFETVNGTSRRGLVAIDEMTGDIDPSFAGAVDRPWSSRRATVRDLQVDADGRIYVAGSFSHLDGIGGSRTQVSKAGRFLDATGVIDGTWKPIVSGGAVWGLDTDPTRNEVAISGFFTSVNGEANTGHFHVVDDITGATTPGKQEMPRNYPLSQLEIFDVVYGNGIVFAIGEQHVIQVLDADNHAMLGYQRTGSRSRTFPWASGFAGGAYQAGEVIGNVVIAGCHCTHATGNHYESFTDRFTTRHNVMAYDATTGRHIEAFDADVDSPRDGHWAAASDTEGCLWIGGDYHVGGDENDAARWLGGFARMCPDGWTPGQPGDGGEANADALVASGATWRYDDSGADLGTAWRTPDHDDAAWATGDAEFGFGDGDETTAWTSGRVTYYARTEFDFAGAVPSSLQLDLAADDGAIVYLNGVEILRDNLPDGPVDASTTAVTWRAGDAERLQPHIVASGALVQGRNVVAVEVHNVWSRNNDLSFDLRLSPSDQPGPAEPPTELVAPGAIWAHTDSAAGEPVDWKQGLQGVATGAAELGFGDNDETTTLTPGRTAYYFTRDFEVADPAQIQQLVLGLAADDGAVVYLNGTEIHRYNMPDGPVGPDTRPITWVAGADERFKETTLPADAIVAGTNTVAVEVHNLWAGNSDLTFDLYLTN